MKHLKILLLIINTTLYSSCPEAKTKEKTETIEQAEHNEKIEPDFIQQKITNNLYILKSPNYNTNVGVFIGDESILLIDPMTGANNHQNLLNTIRQLSEKPIKYVINTHNHGDHSGANSFFSKVGATIISQENVKYSRAKYDATFKDHYIVDMGNEKVELFHIASHTFDDALIYFTDNNTVFMGDTFMTNSFPHFYYGGGSKGHLEIINKALSLGNENTTIIPAHGKLASSKKELNIYKENSAKWINRIAELHNLGKTSDEIIKDEQIKELSTVFNGGKSISIKGFIQTIEKTISVDLIPSTFISTKKLKNYEGKYSYNDGKTDEIVLLGSKLILRQEGAYIYEIVPITEIKFHIKGQSPHSQITFDSDHNEFVHFNGKENLKAKRK